MRKVLIVLILVLFFMCACASNKFSVQTKLLIQKPLCFKDKEGIGYAINCGKKIVEYNRSKKDFYVLAIYMVNTTNKTLSTPKMIYLKNNMMLTVKLFSPYYLATYLTGITPHQFAFEQKQTAYELNVLDKIYSSPTIIQSSQQNVNVYVSPNNNVPMVVGNTYSDYSYYTDGNAFGKALAYSIYLRRMKKAQQRILTWYGIYNEAKKNSLINYSPKIGAKMAIAGQLFFKVNEKDFPLTLVVVKEKYRIEIPLMLLKNNKKQNLKIYPGKIKIIKN